MEKFTENLFKQLKGMPQQVRDHVLEGVLFYKKQYEENRLETNGLSVAYGYGKEVDRLIKEEKKGLKKEFSCKKGCSYCCSIEVYITEDEADLLLAHCKDSGIAIDWEKVKRQTEYKGDWTEQKDPRCVFLDEDGSCKVYECRPIGCRKLFVLSDPELCDTVKYPGGNTERVAFTEPEMIASGIMNAIEGGNLPQMLMKINKK
jgi:Fe-S-cluster containining protein